MNKPLQSAPAAPAVHDLPGRQGYHINDLQITEKQLALLSAINRLLSQNLPHVSKEEKRDLTGNLPLLLKNSLNLLAQEIHLPFLLLSIQNEYNDEAIIVESSVIMKHSDGKHNAAAEYKPCNLNYRHSYRPGEGIIGLVVKNKKPYLCPDIHKAPEFLNRTGLKEQFSDSPVGFLCLPIMPAHQMTTEARVIGTLSSGLYYPAEPERLLADSEERHDGERHGGKHHNREVSGKVSLEKLLLDSPVFNNIRELAQFLKIVCELMANTVHLRIELELEQQRLQRANAILHSRISQNESLQKIVGRSSVMQELFLQITQVARVNTTVLILGESGTGKELVARAIHQGSNRAKRPFVSVNCAALPEGVIDSELFGHVKGAFTGALQNRKGRFEQAEGGTLFLDEISELPMHLQSKLLRVLQEKEYQPLGSELTRSTDVRIIAASNRDLESSVQKYNFREDLFFRLSVFPIYLAPLRERKSDITLLVDHLLEKSALRLGTNVARLAHSAIDLLMAYNWPGNVRELENVIERASILCEDGVIYAHHLPPTLQSGKSAQSSLNLTLKEAVERLELDMIHEALKDNKGNMRLAAKNLGITERQIGLRMRRYNLEYKEFRQ